MVGRMIQEADFPGRATPDRGQGQRAVVGWREMVVVAQTLAQLTLIPTLQKLSSYMPRVLFASFISLLLCYICHHHLLYLASAPWQVSGCIVLLTLTSITLLLNLVLDKFLRQEQKTATFFFASQIFLLFHFTGGKPRFREVTRLWSHSHSEPELLPWSL